MIRPCRPPPIRIPQPEAIPPDPRNQRKVAQGGWTIYDFANTIFSYAVVSTAIGLWLTSDDRFGPGPGQLVLGITIAVSVGINALVSPLLGALSDRDGRRMPFLFLFTVLHHRAVGDHRARRRPSSAPSCSRSPTSPTSPR